MYRISSLSLVEHKYSHKTRLIVDMSASHSHEDTSINSMICQGDFSLQYIRLGDAISHIAEFGMSTQMCKFDIKDAFKQVSLHVSLWQVYGVKCDNKYYLYTRLVFGSRSSPKVFDCVSQAFWISECCMLHCILHLLDDFCNNR